VSLVFALLVVLAQAATPQPAVPKPASQNAPPPAPQTATPAAPQAAPPAAPQNASPAGPKNLSPPKPTVEPTPDPASSHFLSEAGLLLVAIKPTGVADYELVIRSLQEALSKATDPLQASAAKGWHVFKSTETDAKGNQLYVHVMLPTVTGFDYRPSLLVDELLKDLAPELLFRYQDAFAMPPTKLNLTEFANMGVAPLPPSTTAKPETTKPEIKKPPGQ
jgi:hypothetical protein